MANNVQDIILKLRAIMDVSDIKANANQIQNYLSKLRLSPEMMKGFESEFKKLESELSTYQQKLNSGFKTKGDVSSFTNSGKKIVQIYDNIAQKMQKISTTDIHFKINSDELKAAYDKIDNLQKLLQDNWESSGLNGILGQINQLNSKSGFKEKLKIAIETQDLESASTAIQGLVSNMKAFGGTVGKSFGGFTDQFRGIGEAIKTGNFGQAATDLQKLSTSITSTKDVFANNEAIKNFAEEIQKVVTTLQTDPSSLGNGFEDLIQKFYALETNSESLNTFKKALYEIITTFGNADTAGIENFIQQIKQAAEEAKDLGDNLNKEVANNFKDSQAEAGKSAQAVRDYANSAQEAAQSSQQFGAQLDMFKNRVGYFFGLTNAVQLFKRAVQGAFETVKELDASMTETAVVTDFSVGDMWDQLPQYTKTAQQLGTSIKGVYDATTLFYQQGLNTNQAFALGTESLKMARIAGLDYEDATNRMTAALRGFNMELNEDSAQRVNDVYSELAAITASDVDELSTAMDKTASLANSVGMDFETTSAFLAQGIETTRESADSIGTALKTVLARFAEVKKAPDGIANVDGEEVDINKVEAALRSAGVQLRDTNGEFREMGDVFLELSSKWNTLDLMTQRYIATQAAGSRQQSRFIAMMSDYDRTIELIGAAENSAGASNKQFGKTTESLAFKLEELGVAWDTFLMGLSNSDAIKGAVDILTFLVNGLTHASEGATAFGDSVFKITLLVNAFNLFKNVIIKGLEEISSIMFNGGKKAGEQFANGAKSTVNQSSRIFDQWKAQQGKNSKFTGTKGSINVKSFQNYTDKQIMKSGKDAADAYIKGFNGVSNEFKGLALDPNSRSNKQNLQNYYESTMKNLSKQFKMNELQIDPNFKINEDGIKGLDQQYTQITKQIQNSMEVEATTGGKSTQVYQNLSSVLEQVKIKHDAIKGAIEAENQALQQGQSEKMAAVSIIAQQQAQSFQKVSMALTGVSMGVGMLETGLEKIGPLSNETKAIFDGLSGTLSAVSTVMMVMSIASKALEGGIEKATKANRKFAASLIGIQAAIPVIAAVAAVIATVVAIIGAAVKASEEAKERERQKIFDAATEAEEAANANRDKLESYDELYEKYQTGLATEEEMRQSSRELVEAYDLQGQELNILAGNYDEVAKAAKEAQNEMDKANRDAQKKAAQTNADQIKNAKLKGLNMNIGKFNGNGSDDPQKLVDLLTKEFEDAGLNGKIKISRRGQNVDIGGIEGLSDKDFVKYLDALDEAMLKYGNAMPDADIYERYLELSESISSYAEALQSNVDLSMESMTNLYKNSSEANLNPNISTPEEYSTWLEQQIDIYEKVNDIKEGQDYSREEIVAAIKEGQNDEETPMMALFSKINDLPDNTDLKNFLMGNDENNSITQEGYKLLANGEVAFDENTSVRTLQTKLASAIDSLYSNLGKTTGEAVDSYLSELSKGEVSEETLNKLIAQLDYVPAQNSEVYSSAKQEWEAQGTGKRGFQEQYDYLDSVANTAQAVSDKYYDNFMNNYGKNMSLGVESFKKDMDSIYGGIDNYKNYRDTGEEEYRQGDNTTAYERAKTDYSNEKKATEQAQQNADALQKQYDSVADKDLSTGEEILAYAEGIGGAVLTAIGAGTSEIGVGVPIMALGGGLITDGAVRLGEDASAEAVADELATAKANLETAKQNEETAKANLDAAQGKIDSENETIKSYEGSLSKALYDNNINVDQIASLFKDEDNREVNEEKITGLLFDLAHGISTNENGEIVNSEGKTGLDLSKTSKEELQQMASELDIKIPAKLDEQGIEKLRSEIENKVNKINKENKINITVDSKGLKEAGQTLEQLQLKERAEEMEKFSAKVSKLNRLTTYTEKFNDAWQKMGSDFAVTADEFEEISDEFGDWGAHVTKIEGGKIYFDPKWLNEQKNGLSKQLSDLLSGEDGLTLENLQLKAGEIISDYEAISNAVNNTSGSLASLGGTASATAEQLVSAAIDEYNEAITNENIQTESLQGISQAQSSLANDSVSNMNVVVDAYNAAAQAAANFFSVVKNQSTSSNNQDHADGGGTSTVQASKKSTINKNGKTSTGKTFTEAVMNYDPNNASTLNGYSETEQEQIKAVYGLVGGQADKGKTDTQKMVNDYIKSIAGGQGAKNNLGNFGGNGGGGGGGGSSEKAEYDGDIFKELADNIEEVAHAFERASTEYDQLLQTTGTTIEDLRANLEKQLALKEDELKQSEALYKIRQSERDDAIKNFNSIAGKNLAKVDDDGSVFIDEVQYKNLIESLTTDSDKYKDLTDAYSKLNDTESNVMDLRDSIESINDELFELTRVPIELKAFNDFMDVQWQRTFDMTSNLDADLEDIEREQEKLTDRFDELIETAEGSAAEIIANMASQRALNEESIAKNQEKIALYQAYNRSYWEEFRKQFPEIDKYANYDYDTDELRLNYDNFDELSGNKELLEAYKQATDVVGENSDAIDDCQDAIWEAEEALEELKIDYEDGLSEIFNMVKDYYEGQIQDQIDELSKIDEDINENNQKLMDSIQDAFEKERQARENEKTEKDLADKQAKIAYLERDTTGGNQVEIANLKKEFQEAQEDYVDSLIDQKLDEMQDALDEAAEQREKQIETLEDILEELQENIPWAMYEAIAMTGIGPWGITPGSITAAARNYATKDMNTIEKKQYDEQMYINARNASIGIPVDAITTISDTLIPIATELGVIATKLGLNTEGTDKLVEWLSSDTLSDNVLNWISKLSSLSPALGTFSKILNFGNLLHFASGGLSTSTGPAWLDGTPQNPEYVLNADQTKAFLELKDYTRDFLNKVNGSSSSSTETIGGNNYYVNVNIESMNGTEQDVANLMDEVRKQIVNASDYRNVRSIKLMR